MQLALRAPATGAADPAGVVDGGAAAGRIGPNAITRLAQAITGMRGPGVTREVFAAAGKAHYLTRAPLTMVDEAEVIALHRAARARLARAAMDEVAWRAGELTGDYILAKRIPAFARMLLPRLPLRLSVDLLARAVSRHAWTFAGSGTFTYRRHPEGLELSISDSPLTRGVATEAPACHYYSATFQRLFQRLVSAEITVVETDCAAAGADACRFVIQIPA